MMTMPAELARAWGPMWHPNAHPSRPWWRMVDGHPFIYVRLDGWRVERGFSGGIFAKPPGDILAEMPGLTFVDDGMAYVDTNHPLPAPDPMPGQVWVSAGGTECMIAAAWRSGGSWLVQWASNPDVPALWEPPTSVLVAGPTPWGRDVPWVPMWKE